MLKDALSQSFSIPWGLMALILFFMIFIFMLVWVFRPSAKKDYEKMNSFPLDTDSTQQISSQN